MLHVSYGACSYNQCHREQLRNMRTCKPVLLLLCMQHVHHVRMQGVGTSLLTSCTMPNAFHLPSMALRPPAAQGSLLEWSQMDDIT